MTAPLRVCPKCRHHGSLAAFALVPAGLTPPQHKRRRRCPACGAELAAWAFRGRPVVTGSVLPGGLVPLRMHGVDDDGVDHPPHGLTDDEKYLAVIDRMIDLEQALRRVLRVHVGPCRLDHEGFCQEHCFEQPCGVAVARRVLAASAPQEATP